MKLLFIILVKENDCVPTIYHFNQIAIMEYYKLLLQIFLKFQMQRFFVYINFNNTNLYCYTLISTNQIE